MARDFLASGFFQAVYCRLFRLVVIDVRMGGLLHGKKEMVTIFPLILDFS